MGKDEVEKVRRWREKNRDYYLQKTKEYNASRKKEQAIYHKQYRNGPKREHLLKEKIRDYNENKDHYSKLAKLRYQENSEEIKAKTNAYFHATKTQVKLEVLSHYSKGKPRCKCCGNKGIIEFLTIDHIHGRKNEAKRRTGITLYRWLKSQSYPKGYQILCWNCNCSKGFYGICSHKEKYQYEDNFLGRYKKQVFEHYSGINPKCECCNESDIGFLTVDHIKGNGSKHKTSHGIGSIYVWLAKNNFPTGFRILCFNCNSGRNLTKNKICPHKLH